MNLMTDLQQALEQRDQAGLKRRRRVVATPCGPHVVVDGRPMLAFCSNDYLGLAAHPRLSEAMREGAERYGAGSGASHLISGHSVAHERLEAALAEYLSPSIERVRTLSFSTGYMANLAMVTALADRDADIFSETLNHASLIDAARLSRAQIQVYPHRDVEALATMLAASKAHRKLVLTDSVFSMDGNIAPLIELVELCERYGAFLLVDDAHGFGVLGEHGRGVLEHFNIRSPHVVYMGTLGKAAGVSGAFVAAHETVIETLLQTGRSYIFTTAAAPATAHAVCASLALIGGEEGQRRRRHLRQLISHLRQSLDLHQWTLMPSETPIQPVCIGSNQAALAAAAGCDERGLWVPAIRPPTVPAGTARLRISLSAAHSVHDVQRLVETLNELDLKT